MLVSRSGLSPEMVGRQAELAELQRLTRAATDQQQPMVALVSAEAGVGKTRLVRELVAGAPAGTTVLAGHADERDVDRPFSVLREAVQDHVAVWKEPPEPLARFHHPLGHLLGSLLPLPDHPTDGHSHGSDELLRTGVALVRHLAGGGPAIVAFDDLHWADAESLELFVRLATAAGLPALVVGAFRPEEHRAGHPLSLALDVLGRRQDVCELHLENLSRSELQALAEVAARGPVAAGVVDALHERTLGNPFFAEELLDATLKAGYGADVRYDPTILSGTALPWTATEAVSHRLERLDDGDRRVVEAAAVLGRQFSFMLLSEVLSVDEVALVDACRRLVAAGILVERGSDEFTFRHALTYEAVEQQLLEVQRRRIHALALDRLTAADESDHGRLARHALGAGALEQAVAHLRRAAEGARDHGASRQALHFARTGVGLAADDVLLHGVAARAAADLGQVEEAVRFAGRWARCAVARDDAAEESAAHCLLVWLHWSQGDPDATWEAVGAALQAAEASGDGATLAMALAVKAQVHMLSGDERAAISWADRALAAAEAVEARATRAHALVTKGTAIWDLGAADNAPEAVAEASQLIDSGRREALAVGDTQTLMRALNNLLVLGQGVGSVEDMRRLVDEARDIADRYGLERFAAKAASHDANLGMIEGRRDRVEAALAEGQRWASAPMDLVWCTTVEAMLLIEAGRSQAARAVLDDYWPMVARMGNPEAHLDFAAAEAALAAATADPVTAEAALRRATELLPQLKPLPVAAWWEAAIAALDAGVDAGAVEDLLRSGSPPRLRRFAGLVHHAEGALHQAAGRMAEAVASLRRALGERQDFRPAMAVSDIRVRLAGLVADADEAAGLARGAIVLLEHWPGVRLDAARALLARLEGRSSSRADVLTAREREVLQLVAEGLTNREIARTLVIAQKTVATHVSNILAKTATSSRTQAAAWAAKAGVLASADRALGEET